MKNPTAHQHRMYNDVEFLTSLRPFRNYRNLEILVKSGTQPNSDEIFRGWLNPKYEETILRRIVYAPISRGIANYRKS